MESLLEIQRRCHEERERLVKVMVDEFMEKKPSDKDKIFSDHRVKIFLDQYVETTSQLADLYEDKEGERKAEIAALSGPNEFTEFYSSGAAMCFIINKRTLRFQ